MCGTLYSPLRSKIPEQMSLTKRVGWRWVVTQGNVTRVGWLFQRVGWRWVGFFARF